MLRLCASIESKSKEYVPVEKQQGLASVRNWLVHSAAEAGALLRGVSASLPAAGPAPRALVGAEEGSAATSQSP